jgi:hypothetical protein
VVGLALVFMIAAAPSLWALWIQDGLPVCTGTNPQYLDLRIISDAAGGAIVAWRDYRGLDLIYAQRVHSSGAVQWTANGVAVCTTSSSQFEPQITPDGSGGAIIVWEDYRNGNADIYAQRINAWGARQWAADGVAICTATTDQHFPQVVSDGAGGAIITWASNDDVEPDSVTLVYAQRVDAYGTAQWTAGGMIVSSSIWQCDNPQIISDGMNGAIIIWLDYRYSGQPNPRIYAQRIDGSGVRSWDDLGVAVSSKTSLDSPVYPPRIISDGDGGAIVAWQSCYLELCWYISVQRISAAGAVQWTADGILLANGEDPRLATDGAGGAIITWWDNYIDYFCIRAQRVTATGEVQWTGGGIPISEYGALRPAITSDGDGGAIVCWERDVDDIIDDIFAQRIDALGRSQWVAGGVPVCTATGFQFWPELTSDGRGGAIVAWLDHRGSQSIYAQAIDGNGRAAMNAPAISAIQDVPRDQGGWVRITIDRSRLDDALAWDSPIAWYEVWRRVDSSASEKAIGEANTISPGAFSVKSEAVFPSGTWELLGKYAACQETQYIYCASTLADSVAAEIPYSVFIVSAHTSNPSVWFISEADSGYSVDNKPPETPQDVSAKSSYEPEGLEITWNANSDNDIAHYSLYRGLSDDFLPGPGNLVASPNDAIYFDADWRSEIGYYYKLSAVDIHGNESGFALLSPEDITGAETLNMPNVTSLWQNYPNPFNPETRITYDLATPGLVSLRVYDARGCLVRVLVKSVLPAGRHAMTWNGKDANENAVSSGIYFFRLDAGSFSQTRKMVLLR